MTEAQRIQARIEELERERQQLEEEKTGIVTSRRQKLVSGAPDSEVNSLDSEIEKFIRDIERKEETAKALREQLPAAERLDAKARMKEIAEGYASRISKLADLKSQCDELAEKLGATVEQIFAQLSPLPELRGEAEFLSLKYGLRFPDFKDPSNSLPSPAVTGDVFMRMRNINIALTAPAIHWTQKTAEERRHQKIERRSAAGAY